MGWEYQSCFSALSLFIVQASALINTYSTNESKIREIEALIYYEEIASFPEINGVLKAGRLQDLTLIYNLFF